VVWNICNHRHQSRYPVGLEKGTYKMVVRMLVLLMADYPLNNLISYLKKFTQVLYNKMNNKDFPP
jgi:hypothetical protein